MDLPLVAVCRAPGRCWRFQFASTPQRSAALLPDFRDTLGSFHLLSAAEAAAIRPLRARPPGEARRDGAALARAMPAARAEERFRVTNGLGPDEQVQPSQWVKLTAE